MKKLSGVIALALVVSFAAASGSARAERPPTATNDSSSSSQLVLPGFFRGR